MLCVSDFIDGYLARRYGTTSSGAFLDPLADKVLVLGAMFTLVACDMFWILPVAIIAAREFIISIYRTVASSKGVSVPASKLGKWKTFVQQLAVGFALWPWFAVDAKWVWVSLLWLAVVLSVLSGAHYLWYATRGSRTTRCQSGDLMRCDVLAVGTELLLGQIVDTNSAWLGEQLAANGIDSLVQVKIGDNVVAHRRPTASDARRGRCRDRVRRTRPDPRRPDPPGDRRGDGRRRSSSTTRSLSVIRELFASSGRRMSDNNLRQAEVPVGASIIPQTRGTAPGLICPVTVGEAQKVVFADPGRAARDARDVRARRSCPSCSAGRGRRLSSPAACCARGVRARAGSTSDSTR